jgi:hypothetical protein
MALNLPALSIDVFNILGLFASLSIMSLRNVSLIAPLCMNNMDHDSTEHKDTQNFWLNCVTQH